MPCSCSAARPVLFCSQQFHLQLAGMHLCIHVRSRCLCCCTVCRSCLLYSQTYRLSALLRTPRRCFRPGTKGGVVTHVSVAGNAEHWLFHGLLSRDHSNSSNKLTRTASDTVPKTSHVGYHPLKRGFTFVTATLSTSLFSARL